MSWDSVSDFLASKSGGKNNGEIFMKLDSKHQVRLVGEPKQVLSAWYNNRTLVVPNDPEYIKKVEELLDVKVSKNLAVNVIDRADQKKRLEEGKSTRFKILMKGNSIFQTILTTYEEVRDEKGNKVHPGGPGGSDWKIIVSRKIASDKRSTQYQVVALAKSPFTKEEIAVIKRADINGKNVKDEFKDLPFGEKGLIDLDAMYNEDKARKNLDKLFSELGESGVPASDSDPVSALTSLDEEEVKEKATETEEETTGLEDLDKLF